MKDRRDLATLLLVAAGAVVAHGIGYAAAEAVHGPAAEIATHDTLDRLGWLALPLTFAALVGLAVRRSGAVPLGDLGLARRLVLFQLPLLTVQEVGEHVAAGRGVTDLLSQTGFWLVLVAVVPVTALLVWLSRSAETLAARLRCPRPRHRRTPPPASRAPMTEPRTAFLVIPIGGRAPPRLLL